MLTRRQRPSSLGHETPDKKSHKTSKTKKSPKDNTVKKIPSATQKKSKKEDSSPQKQPKKPNSKLIRTTQEHYKLIDELLQFTIQYNHPTGLLIGSCGFSVDHVVYNAFPCLTRKPVGRGQLPVINDSNPDDVGYFLGASQPGYIALVIKDAFQKCFPSSDSKAAGWENWEVWKFNSMYYSPDVFIHRKPYTLQDLREEIQSGREFGGSQGRTKPKIVSTCTQKIWSFAVPLEEAYKTGFPYPEDSQICDFDPGFAKMNDLMKLNENFIESLHTKKNQNPVKLKKQKTKKLVEKAEELDSDSDEDGSSSDSENGDETETKENEQMSEIQD